MATPEQKQAEKIAAAQIILKSEYNNTRWKAFLSELFKSSNFFSNPTLLPGINSSIASQALQIGSITINESGIARNIAVYEVKLAENVVLERNRVGLRNLLKPHWKEQDAAFIVYHHPQAKSWRFSYVSELKKFNEAGEYVANNTEPKRYTYVLGENESCRTAAIQFSKLQEKANNATLDDVKEAFSVEKMSDDFFKEYKEHYQDFVQFLTGKRLEKVSGKWEEVVKHAPNAQLISIFNNNEKDVRDFCKKLLGRIVFLYFIQKKGWLGVPVKDDWGKGNYNYLSELFKNCRNPAIFYSEYLSKLFFDTLNQQRPNDTIEIIPGEPCRIPYLNGGLFEEDDQNHRNLVLEAKLFRDLFTFFDQYNFTIYEDDPNDHTVAVDPEMLGHIFENLLEDNKDKGAFYTPKEIVHYMCQESLIEYLTTWFEGQGYTVQQDSFISFNHPAQTSFISANDGRAGQGVLEITQTSPPATKHINRSIIEKLLKKQLSDDDKQAIIQHAHSFNKALDDVKICDPAIGSGAFPMGLLLEIFTAKQTIYAFTHSDLTSFEPAKVKLNIIQNSIYGVDIERGAVDIARLRFWLSLVVDEPAPQALPNLDYKIVVGNSLISKLGDDIIEIDWDIKKNTTLDIFGEQETKSIQNILRQITSLQKEFFNPNASKKDQAAKIRDLKIDLLIEQLNLMINSKGIATKPAGNTKAAIAQTERYMQTEGWKQQIKKLLLLKTQHNKSLEFFDWQLNFAEVLNKDVEGRSGFDIVVGNPPYKILTQNNTHGIDLKVYLTNYMSIRNASSKNIYTLFIEKGINLLTQKGKLSYIVPEGLFVTRSYEECVKILNTEGYTQAVVTFTNYVFESAVTGNIIFRFSKGDVGLTKKFHFDQNYTLNAITEGDNSIFRKIESLSVPLNSVAMTFKGMVVKDREKVIADEPLNKKHIFLLGKSISKWNINKKWFTNYEELEIIGGTKKLVKHNTYPRVLIRRTGDNLCCAYLDEPALTESTLYSTWSTSPLISTKVLYGILNSRLLNFFNHERNITNQQGFPQILMTDLESLPVCIPSKSVSTLLEDLIDKILNDSQVRQNFSSIERTIDSIIYRLYGLSFDDVKLVEPDYSISEAEYNAINA
ncbi:MAG TPA: TaqI-like C-terminal specificity domain-containing protein [Methylotenera sp.]|nr:TaqI-like C-terminal specificity domain-containing protein [Methylotenera sp.]